MKRDRSASWPPPPFNFLDALACHVGGRGFEPRRSRQQDQRVGEIPAPFHFSELRGRCGFPQSYFGWAPSCSDVSIPSPNYPPPHSTTKETSVAAWARYASAPTAGGPKGTVWTS